MSDHTKCDPDYRTLISRVSDGDSVDRYFTCGTCSRIVHVYTYDPMHICHVNVHEKGTWTDGYAHGLARGQRGNIA